MVNHRRQSINQLPDPSAGLTWSVENLTFVRLLQKRLRLECLQTTVSFCFFNTLRLDRAPVSPHYAACRGLETLEIYCAPPPSRGTSTQLSCPMWIHPLPKQLSNIVLKSECVAGALSSWTFFLLLVLVKTLPSGAFQILQLQLPRRLVFDNFMIVEPFLLFLHQLESAANGGLIS